MEKTLVSTQSLSITSSTLSMNGATIQNNIGSTLQFNGSTIMGDQGSIIRNYGTGAIVGLNVAIHPFVQNFGELSMNQSGSASLSRFATNGTTRVYGDDTNIGLLEFTFGAFIVEVMEMLLLLLVHMCLTFDIRVTLQ